MIKSNRKNKLPSPDTLAWEEEKALYLTLDSVARATRAEEIGYANSNSYTTAMERRGVFLSRPVPKSITTRYNKPLILREPSLIIFDTQIPFQDAGFLNKCLELAQAWGIKQGISGGDLLNMAAFSMFKEKPDVKIWAKERDAAIKTLEALHSFIPSWLFIMGNHEAFLIKSLAEQIGHEDILRLLDSPEGFKATDYYYCIVRFGKGPDWRVSHPRNISVIHGRIPQRLCEKFHCNIASGHGHLAGMTPDYSGKYVACDVGITCDPARLDYAALRDSVRPAMNKGALILQLGDDGYCYPYHLTPAIDWEAMAKLYRR